MQKHTLTTLLASASILGSSMVGCSGAGLDRRPALKASQVPAIAPRIETALVDKDYARALMQAEELVLVAPNDGAYRALLGRAYLANGRYASARTAFNDALTLGNTDIRTIVSLALCETGLGNEEGARALLSAHIQDLPAADYGLAMAIAGDPREGVRALLEATKQPDATAQTRQNLAYALALGGSWGQARLIAGQDLSAKDAEARIGQWSQALAGGTRSRVVAMVGVSPRADDGGLPAHLALNAAPVDAAPVQTASFDIPAPARESVIEPVVAVQEPVAAPAPVAVAAPQPAIETAQAKPESPDTMTLATAFETVPASPAPLVRAPGDPMRSAVRAAFQRAGATDAQVLAGRVGMSRMTSLSPKAPVADMKASDWVIQLGAFNSVAIAKDKWQSLSRGKAGLAKFREIHSEISLNGRAFHRLAIRGFDDRASAMALCGSLRASGQSCFVRLDDSGTTRMARAQAGKPAPQVAARKAGGKPVKQVAARKPVQSNSARQIAAR